MIKLEPLIEAGINYQAGLKRFMGDAELYEMVLSAYARDDLIQRARAAYDADDREALLRVVHETKGSSGNADLTCVYETACALVTLLRSKSYSDAQLQEGFLRFEQAYLSMQQAIGDALED